MKSIKVTDVGSLKNELNKYKKGKKLDIRYFNQAARLAWLGKIVMSPLDAEDETCQSWLLFVQPPEGFAAHFVDVDEDLVSEIHVLDAEQGQYLAEIMRAGMSARAQELEALNRRDFYFGKFFKDDAAAPAGETPSSN
ncbi:hypothetical protein [Sulfuriferula nivalis]|uniref:Uncharacterized protein n=1 Tax=Sulfuriferula nivalis TaxID=2675298 RepID=A0A809RHZ5_9PROT|nr:hypothetical protein [Sulfuriferula nivalis]BBP01519.1 hypothetical protein SFSGTM_22270 [Sulfuriferula nivalis]